MIIEVEEGLRLLMAHGRFTDAGTAYLRWASETLDDLRARAPLKLAELGLARGMLPSAHHELSPAEWAKLLPDRPTNRPVKHSPDSA